MKDIALTASTVKSFLKEALEKQGYTLDDVESMLEKQADENKFFDFFTKFLIPSARAIAMTGIAAGGLAGGGLYGLHLLDANTEKQLDKYRAAKEKIDNATQNLKDSLNNPKSSF